MTDTARTHFESDLEGLLVSSAINAPMPAVAIGICDQAGVLASIVHGIANLETGEIATVEHWWDLASLTKVLVTLVEMLAAVQRRQLMLSDSLGLVWSRAVGSPLGNVTIGQLLSYNAGMPASVRYYEGGAASRDALLDAVLSTRPQRTPGTYPEYSDINYIVLGELVTHLTGLGLHEHAKRRGWCRYASPHPLPGPAVATEYCGWRQQLIVGEVHDENAAALGGVAGHAGAFGTIGSVLAGARACLAGELVGPALSRVATQCWASSTKGERFGLGFLLTPTLGLGGDLAGTDGYGCAGFVGNRLWIEPSRGYAVVVLSNRIHPKRDDRTNFNMWCNRLMCDIALAWQGRLAAADE